ncbi:MAG: uracil-DNA glycosylase [Gemmatimonadales bacterium]
MDAKEKLRIYLEQRRDLGESELLLDTLTVEEALRTIGAIGTGKPVSTTSLRENPRDNPPTSDDWREVLSPAAAPTETKLSQAPVSGIIAGGESNELFNSDVMQLGSLNEIAQVVESCTRCVLSKTATRGVPGSGNPNADFMCIGEGPGASEDEQGVPFVGAAGQLLTKILAAVNLSRDDVFITNVVKHRPPGNRNPAPEEITACLPYLVRQLELIKPKVILALGTFAAQTLLDTKTPIGKLRGEVHRYHGIPVVVTYHPAALLRNPSWKRPTWEDVQLARRILDNAIGA